jgi:hypothetical protein
MNAKKLRMLGVLDVSQTGRVCDFEGILEDCPENKTTQNQWQIIQYKYCIFPFEGSTRLV